MTEPSPFHSLIATLPGPGGQATCSAVFSPDGTTPALFSGRGPTTSLWEVAARRETTLIDPDPWGGSGAIVVPVLASSGKTRRPRLNRGGNREAGHARWRIVITRMSACPRPSRPPGRGTAGHGAGSRC